MNWTDCPVIEQIPGKVSGAPVLRHSRVRAQDVIANYNEGADGIAAGFGLPIGDVETVLAFWEEHHAELPMEYFSPEMIRALGADIDWMGCPGITETAATGPTINGTNIRPIDLIANRQQGEEWLMKSYELSLESIRSVLRYYDQHRTPLAPAA